MQPNQPDAGSSGEQSGAESGEDEVLANLSLRFQQGLRRLEGGDLDGAADLFRGVLREEPRLAEPRMELARMCLDTGQLEEAEEQIREAIRILETGGQWVDDLHEDVVQSLAHGLLGEILRQRADSDEMVFGAPERFKALMDEAGAAFRKAATLDPANAHAGYWGFGLRPAGEE